MALTINNLKFTLDFLRTLTEDVVSPTQNRTSLSWAKSLADGTGLDQCDRIWWDTRPLAASASETLDLTALANTFGTVNFARVKLVAIRLPYGATQASSIQVGAAASNPFVAHLGGTTPTFQVRNGGFAVFFAPDATGYVAGTAKNLKVLNNDGTNAASYDIIIAGCSA